MTDSDDFSLLEFAAAICRRSPPPSGLAAAIKADPAVLLRPGLAPPCWRGWIAYHSGLELPADLYSEGIASHLADDAAMLAAACISWPDARYRPWMIRRCLEIAEPMVLVILGTEVRDDRYLALIAERLAEHRDPAALYTAGRWWPPHRDATAIAAALCASHDPDYIPLARLTWPPPRLAAIARCW